MDEKPALRLARTPLWRGPDSVQFGVDPRHALVVDRLSPALAEMLRRIDGHHSAHELLDPLADDERVAAERLLAQLTDAGLVEPAEHLQRVPPALLPDAATWGMRTGRGAAELLQRRATATVAVYGNGRIAVGVACLLAAAAIGAVVVHASGRVTGADLGTGYLPADVGRHRRAAAADAVARARTIRGTLTPGGPDLAVLTDTAVWDPHLALALAADRVPHLAVHAREASAIVGPLVLPGRTSCLRCADLHRTDLDPCWPQVATQLAVRPLEPELACAQVAVGLAAEQVLALLAGRGELPHRPPAVETTFEVDPLHGTITRRRWPVHPRCGCGALAHPRGVGDRTNGPAAGQGCRVGGESRGE